MTEGRAIRAYAAFIPPQPTRHNCIIRFGLSGYVGCNVYITCLYTVLWPRLAAAAWHCRRSLEWMSEWKWSLAKITSTTCRIVSMYVGYPRSSQRQCPHRHWLVAQKDSIALMGLFFDRTTKRLDEKWKRKLADRERDEEGRKRYREEVSQKKIVNTASRYYILGSVTGYRPYRGELIFESRAKCFVIRTPFTRPTPRPIRVENESYRFAVGFKASQQLYSPYTVDKICRLIYICMLALKNSLLFCK